MVARDTKVFANFTHGGTYHSTRMTIMDIPIPPGRALTGQYDVPPANDPSLPYDNTDYVAGQDYLSATNLPYFMGMLPNLDPIRTLKPVVSDDEVDPWGGQLRLFPGILPDKISRKVEGWRILYWRTIGAKYRVTIRDIVARFAPELFYPDGPYATFANEAGMSKLCNDVSMREQRYRKKYGSPRLYRQTYPKEALRRVDTLTTDQILYETCWRVVDDANLGGKLIEQPHSRYKCSFSVPDGLPTTQPSAAITEAKALIAAKKQAVAQQDLPGTGGWWDVDVSGDSKKDTPAGQDSKKRKRDDDEVSTASVAIANPYDYNAATYNIDPAVGQLPYFINGAAASPGAHASGMTALEQNPSKRRRIDTPHTLPDMDDPFLAAVLSRDMNQPQITNGGDPTRNGGIAAGGHAHNMSMSMNIGGGQQSSQHNNGELLGYQPDAAWNLLSGVGTHTNQNMLPAHQETLASATPGHLHDQLDTSTSGGTLEMAGPPNIDQYHANDGYNHTTLPDDFDIDAFLDQINGTYPPVEDSLRHTAQSGQEAGPSIAMYQGQGPLPGHGFDLQQPPRSGHNYLSNHNGPSASIQPQEPYELLGQEGSQLDQSSKEPDREKSRATSERNFAAHIEPPGNAPVPLYHALSVEEMKAWFTSVMEKYSANGTVDDKEFSGFFQRA